jgi:hypothetical protein
MLEAGRYSVPFWMYKKVKLLLKQRWQHSTFKVLHKDQLTLQISHVFQLSSAFLLIPVRRGDVSKLFRIENFSKAYIK